MSRRKRTPEENERREKIRELLRLSNVGSMEDICGRATSQLSNAAL